MKLNKNLLPMYTGSVLGKLQENQLKAQESKNSSNDEKG
jgi:hypothetical protein